MLRAACVLALPLLLPGCVGGNGPTSRDWDHLVDDQILGGLPDVVFNITRISLETGMADQITHQVAHRPQYAPDGRLLFNGYQQSVWLVEGSPTEVGRFGTIVGSGGSCLLVLDATAKKLECVKVGTWERSLVQEATAGCVLLHRASRSEDGEAWSYAEQCGPITSGGHTEPTRLVIAASGGADPFVASGAHSPHFGDGRVAYVASDGLRVFDGSDSHVLLASNEEREFDHPVLRGSLVYFISWVVEKYETGFHGRKPTYDRFEVVKLDANTKDETVLLRTTRFFPGSIELSPDGKWLAVSILHEREN